jgi:hypothetical protein
VRNKDKAPLLEAFGVRPVIGTLDDAAILSAEAKKADYVIHTADSSDHMPACKAILEGMKKRDDNPILIHIVSEGPHGYIPMSEMVLRRAERVYWSMMHAENMVSHDICFPYIPHKLVAF